MAERLQLDILLTLSNAYIVFLRIDASTLIILSWPQYCKQNETKLSKIEG
jgi:hypothetical protein